MKFQVHYEPANPYDKTQKSFDANLSAALTRIFKRFGIVYGQGYLYKLELSSLTDRIKQVNAKLIKDKFGLVHAGIKLLILKMSSYQPLKKR